MTSEPDSNQSTETWNGSCHCGNVKFTLNLRGSLYEDNTTTCNCTICTRNGYLMIYPQHTDITWHSGKDTLKSYKFFSNRIGHRFCPECGTSVCAYSDVPGFVDGVTALNIRTLENVEFEKLKLKKVDGRAIQLGADKLA